MIDGDALAENIENIVDELLEINIFGPNNDIPETNTPNNTNTQANPVATNNSSTINPSTTSNLNSTVNNTSATSGPSNNNSTASNTTTPNNTTNNNSTPIPEKANFESVKLTACDTKTKKRIAKEGEILYYVNSSSKKIDKTDIALTISPNLAKDKIKDNVHWFSNNTAIDKSNGLLKFTTKDLDKDATIKSVAGFPTESTKIVGVKFVDEDKTTQKFTIGTSSISFFKEAVELTKMGEKFTKFLEKTPFIKKGKKNEKPEGKLGFYFDAIPFQQTLLNKEDYKSRLYYNEKTISGGVELGLEGEAKFIIWGIPYDKIPYVPEWVIKKAKKIIKADVYVVAKAKAGGEVKMQYIEKREVEQTNWKKVSEKVNPAKIGLELELGAGAEIGFLEDNDLFSVGGDASGTGKAEIVRLDWENGHFVPKYLNEGVWIDFTAGMYIKVSGIKYETTPINKKMVIIEPNEEP
jgi:hypothetical protein